jgi:hypothetical protein
MKKCFKMSFATAGQSKLTPSVVNALRAFRVRDCFLDLCISLKDLCAYAFT